MALGLDTVGRKLLWSIALPGLFAALLGVGYFWREAQQAARDATHDEAMVLAEFVGTTFRLPTPEGMPPHTPVAELLRSDVRMLRATAELNVLSPDGRIRWSPRPEDVGRRHPEADRLTASSTQWARSDTHSTEVLRPLGEKACEGCHAGAQERPVGLLHLRVAEPEVHRELADALGGALVAVLVLGSMLIVATGTSLHFFLTRPLRRLTAAMRGAEEGDFLVRAEVHGTDEISRLAAAFNAMLARITSMKAEEIDTHRDLQVTKWKLSLKEELEERIAELALLFDVARSVNSTIELSELLSRVTQLVPERLHIPDFSIMLLNSDGLLEVKSSFPADPQHEGMTFQLGEGAAGRAAEMQRVVYVPDIKDPSSSFARHGLPPGNDSGALLSIPMVHTDSVLGVLNFRRPEVASFAPEELELLTAVADQAATAVKNAMLHAEAVKLTMTDPLTGVPNRRHLFARLELEVARSQRFGTPLSILMVDIDHFKRLNDTAGHRAGDESLRRVCDVLRARVRKVDTLARYGGEEFMLVLSNVSKEDAYEVAEKLRRAVVDAPQLAAPTQPFGHITVSIGVATYPLDANTQDTLVDCADSALYASKRAGRNRVTSYEPGMEQHPGRERGLSRPNDPASPSVAKA
ncbi:diguanylate cyclase [Vitiosangium sp. GDMCC 1.1324]|uniref:GGDEF domain-containing protein n=1 Tax=Vitiosangium sp. (strain GDMCC 1.1324) TaxID=2138576 RepID=UPI000D3C99D1|nr:diguanylate cyclase [Vitiosangium sp. GDMCC 1.1324]PTL78278.1 diguanylate cyclase [Vitiosangium sp. GDMCC 1.1324]